MQQKVENGQRHLKKKTELIRDQLRNFGLGRAYKLTVEINTAIVYYHPNKVLTKDVQMDYNSNLENICGRT